MARYDVTPELASIIKSTRVSHNVTAKSVAEHLGKSQAFISKLEKGDLKSIDRDQLIEIFEFILGSEEAFQVFLNETLLPVFSSLTLRHSKEEIDSQIWYTNFDMVLRLIPIPESLIKSINQEMTNNDIGIDELCDRINDNEMLARDICDIESLPSNIWFCNSENGEIKNTYIKLSLSKTDLENILTFNEKSSNYITIFAIVFYLFLFENYGNDRDLSIEIYQANWKKTIDYLNHFQFYSLEQKHYLESRAQTESEHEALMSDFDKDNKKTINEIIQIFKLYSEVDLLRTTNCLTKFKKNLDWDGGFILRIISMDFDTLENTTVDQKRNLLSEIEDTIEKYKTESDNSRNLEFYD